LALRVVSEILSPSSSTTTWIGFDETARAISFV
jgi:hypothetical protein